MLMSWTVEFLNATVEAELDERYNHRSARRASDAERAAALKGVEGKRLSYRRTGEAAHA